MARVERYWDDARAKVGREARCRVCGVGGHAAAPLQFAHTLGRRYDQRVELEDGGVAVYVDADDGVPLCSTCHFAYDRRELSILEYLTLDEQAAAVAHIGVVRALHRLTGLRSLPVEIPTRPRGAATALD